MEELLGVTLFQVEGRLIVEGGTIRTGAGVVTDFMKYSGTLNAATGPTDLIGMHIAEWPGAASQQHEPKRTRRLLLHKEEIISIGTKVKVKGLTLIPLRLYLSRGRCKVEIGLGRGKKEFDKRKSIADREGKREAERELSDWKRGG